jgi:hypothetical protein
MSANSTINFLPMPPSTPRYYRLYINPPTTKMIKENYNVVSLMDPI